MVDDPPINKRPTSDAREDATLAGCQAVLGLASAVLGQDGRILPNPPSPAAPSRGRFPGTEL